jgi:hypothetical protein
MTDIGNTPVVQPSNQIPTVATVACPFCAEQILPAAKKCRFCNEILDPVMRKQQEVSQRGASATATANTTVIVRTRRVNHFLHIFLCFVTLGAWIPIYILVLIFA